MARTETVIVELTDDFDGSSATETVSFSIDGKAFDIDLNKRNAASLRRVLKPYIEAGRASRTTSRPARAKTGTGRRPQSKGKTLFSRLSDDEKVRFRTWAVRRKLTTKAARRIADSAVQAWIDAGRP